MGASSSGSAPLTQCCRYHLSWSVNRHTPLVAQQTAGGGQRTKRSAVRSQGWLLGDPSPASSSSHIHKHFPLPFRVQVELAALVARLTGGSSSACDQQWRTNREPMPGGTAQLTYTRRAIKALRRIGNGHKQGERHFSTYLHRNH